ncbi:RibT protein [Lactobacillus terrae]|uniref:RibT protein n=1 Tax=Lactobacillus terrae TaxID=2269374 RepID=UPI000C1B7AE2|nr:RibT protein [Lactobacillus terrae]
MLIKYSNDNRKVAMGFLSYISDLKELSNLEREIDLFENDDTRQLYLWKSEFADYAGVVAISIESNCIYIEYFSLNPSFRSQSNEFLIYDELKAIYPDKIVLGNRKLVNSIRDWEKQKLLIDNEEVETD